MWAERYAAWRPRCDLWRAERPEPLRLRAWLSAPIAWDAYDGITIEGALQAVVIARASGFLPDDAFDGAPSDFFSNVPVPIEDVKHSGLCAIASASWAIPATSIETVRRKRRRTRTDLFCPGGGRGLLTVSGGPYKNTDVPIATMTTPFVDFFVRGDRGKIVDLLRDVGSIGRARAGGLGALHGVEVDDDPLDRSILYCSRPQRALPVIDEKDAAARFEAGSYDLRVRSTRTPYWHRSSRTLCAVPTPAAFWEST